MRPVRAVFILAVSAVLASASLHLDSAADRSAFRRWFTFLAESRYYARKPLRGVTNSDGLLRWAYRQALTRHDGSWGHSMELPLFPAMPSVRQFESDPETGLPAPAFVSRELEEAIPGDLLLYRRTDLPSHLMIYIGASQIVPSRKRWVVYLSESVHKVSVDSLNADPSPEWRPVPENPEFLGIWRLSLVSDED